MPTLPVSDAELERRYECWLKHNGSNMAAARELKKSETTIRRNVKQARAIFGEREFQKENLNADFAIPDGYKLRGTSTLYDPQTGEAKLEWVKTSEDRERQEIMFREAIKALAGDLPRIDHIPLPDSSDDNLLACYPIGDHHTGLFSWHEETGVDYDIKIAETILIRAMDYLLDATPACNHALVPILGDFTHHDGYDPVTPANKNHLDTDSRFPKIIRVAIRTARYLVERAAQKHEHVTVIVIPGNHDPATAVFLRECLANIYENNPGIEVDTSPGQYNYFRFGKCLIGTYHGHRVKLEKLPMIMATDRPEDWGQTEYRYWLTGHVHHDATKDLVGCKVESIRVLAAPDAWGDSEGYRPMREMKAIIYHRKFGEKARHIVNPEMLK